MCFKVELAAKESIMLCILIGSLTYEADAPLDWDAATTRAEAFVNQLNTSEKVDMVTGGFDVGSCIGNIGPVERLSFRGLCFADGPAGVNRADLVSVFPAGITVAATWDADLMYQRELALGAEFRAKGVNVMLG